MGPGGRKVIGACAADTGQALGAGLFALMSLLRRR